MALRAAWDPSAAVDGVFSTTERKARVQSERVDNGLDNDDNDPHTDKEGTIMHPHQ